LGRAPAESQKAALKLGQFGRRKPAARKGVLSFAQAFAFVSKVDAGNVKKIQDIVVSC
jgi:hypothetical protein